MTLGACLQGSRVPGSHKQKGPSPHTFLFFLFTRRFCKAARDTLAGGIRSSLSSLQLGTTRLPAKTFCSLLKSKSEPDKVKMAKVVKSRCKVLY